MQHKKDQALDEVLCLGLIQRDLISIWREVNKSDSWQNPTNMTCSTDNNNSVMAVKWKFPTTPGIQIIRSWQQKEKINKKLLILGCHRFIILSNNCRFSPFLDSIIALTQPILPADRTRGGLVKESDNRKLSDKLRTLYKPVWTCSPAAYVQPLQ